MFLKVTSINRGFKLVARSGMLLVLAFTPAAAQADDWPQWLGPQRDGVWREQGILESFPKNGPTIRWRVPVGAGYAGPAVAGPRIYITDRLLEQGSNNPANPFSRGAVAGKERVLCLDDATGRMLWTHEYDCRYQVSYPAGPRTTPVVAGDKVYTLGAMGDLLCLDAEKGTVIWAKNLLKEYMKEVPLWGFAAHPLVDGDKLICLVGGHGSVAVAFQKDTGKELWKALDAREPGYCPPMIFDIAGKRQLIIWDPEAINSLDPENGKLNWSQKFAIKAALTIPTPRVDSSLLLVTSFYNGSMMLKLDPDRAAPSVLWKGKSNSEQPNRTDGLHSIMSTPFIKNGYIYGVCSYGELRCLKENTGQRIWETLQATSGGPPKQRWSNAFIVAQGDRFFLFNEKGDLIIAHLTPELYQEISRAHIIEPTNRMVRDQREDSGLVVWSHPAFAHRSVYARNDKELVCVSLAAEAAR